MNGTEHDPTPGANFAGKQYSLLYDNPASDMVSFLGQYALEYHRLQQTSYRPF